jgi:hypothetical protein
VGKIVTTPFCAVKTTTQAEDDGLSESLKMWEDNLPPEMQYSAPDGTLGPGFWSCMLHMAYTYVASLVTKCWTRVLTNYFSNASIYLHRPKSVMNTPSIDAEREAVAIAAAGKTTRMVEDLLASGSFHCAQLHMYVPILAI